MRMERYCHERAMERLLRVSYFIEGAGVQLWEESHTETNPWMHVANGEGLSDDGENDDQLG